MTYSGWGLYGQLPGLVLAHTVLALPFVIVAAGVSARQIDITLELAAQGLGANRRRVFWRITLPLILPGVAAGAIFAFATSWDEVVIANFMTSPTFQTLPVLFWTEVRALIQPDLAVVATFLVVLVAVVAIGTPVFRRVQWTGRLTAWRQK